MRNTLESDSELLIEVTSGSTDETLTTCRIKLLHWIRKLITIFAVRHNLLRMELMHENCGARSVIKSISFSKVKPVDLTFSKERNPVPVFPKTEIVRDTVLSIYRVDQIACF